MIVQVGRYLARLSARVGDRPDLGRGLLRSRGDEQKRPSVGKPRALRGYEPARVGDGLHRSGVHVHGDQSRAGFRSLHRAPAKDGSRDHVPVRRPRGGAEEDSGHGLRQLEAREGLGIASIGVRHHQRTLLGGWVSQPGVGEASSVGGEAHLRIHAAEDAPGCASEGGNRIQAALGVGGGLRSIDDAVAVRRERVSPETDNRVGGEPQGLAARELQEPEALQSLLGLHVGDVATIGRDRGRDHVSRAGDGSDRESGPFHRWRRGAARLDAETQASREACGSGACDAEPDAARDDDRPGARCRGSRAWDFKIDPRLADIAEPLLRIALEAAFDQLAIARGQVLRQQVPVDVLPKHGGESVARRLALEESRAAQHLKHHHAEGPDVGPLVDGLASRLFRAHVRRGPEDDPGFGRLAGHGGGVGELRGAAGRACLGVEGLGQAEVEYLDLTFGRHFDVGGLEVAMHDALLVRGLQPFRDLFRENAGFIDGDRSPPQPLLEIFALHQFEGEGHALLGLLEAVDRRDIGMIEGGEDLGLPPEAGHPLLILREGRGQDLDRDVASELHVPRAIDLAHAAFADGGDDLVGAEAGARL